MLKENNIPFYEVWPSTILDMGILYGLKEIPIEEHDQDEVRYFEGKRHSDGEIDRVLICPERRKHEIMGLMLHLLD